MKNKLLTILIVLMSASFMVACPKGDNNDSSDTGDSIVEPSEAVSAPASQINVDNADAQADAILKDIENL